MLLSLHLTKIIYYFNKNINKSNLVYLDCIVDLFITKKVGQLQIILYIIA